MEQFIAFFESLSSAQKVGWILACLSLNWVLEFILPMFKFGYTKWKHTLVNLFFLLITMAIHSAFGIVTVMAVDWGQANQFGLLHLLTAPPIVELIIAVMMLDFMAQYVVHYCLHHNKWMWRFHMIHHSDTKVDATTGTRHHPGDYITRELFALLAVLIFGIPFAFYAFYKIVTVFFSYASHSNIRLPLAVDRVLSYVFITPNIHKFHHHYELPWTDTNFGNVFSFWDRMFGTLVQGDPKEVKYGLDIVDGTKDENIGYQLMIPFDMSIQSSNKIVQEEAKDAVAGPAA